MLNVHRAGGRDAASVAQLMTEFNQADPAGFPSGEDTTVTVQQARHRLGAIADIEMVLLAAWEDEEAGLLSVRIVPHLDQDVPYAEVTNLCVKPSHRRRGVAMALMAHAERLAWERGCTSIHLVVGPDNATAQAFYRAVGYELHDVGLKKFLRGPEREHNAGH